MSDSPTSAHSTLPKQIVVARTPGNGLSIIVDGVPFELPVAADPGPVIHPALPTRPYELLTVSLLAERVELVTMAEPEDGPES